MQMKYGEAEVSFRLSLEGRKTTLQKDHQDTLLSKHWLARTLHELKRYPEAEELFEETLQAQERTLRKGHDDILWSRHRLAKTRFELKKYSEAEEAFQQMLNLGEEKRGPKHRDIRWKLARTLFELEKYTEAEQLFDQALRERKETPGINQSDILSSEHWLARTWFMQKKYGEAEASFRHSLEGQKTTLLDEHPNTLLSKYWLARTLYELERYPEAANLFLEVEGRGQAPGHEGQDTCSSTQWLMKIRNQHLQVSLSSRSQPDEAVSSYTQIASRHTPMRDQTQPAPQEQPNAVVSAGPPTSSSNTGSVSVLELPHHSKSRPSSYSEREYLALRPKVAFSSRSLFEPAPMGITMDSNG
jgi:TolA-binding protein